VPYSTKVTIVGDLKTATVVVVTYHDVCMNHRWCFSRLMHCMNGAGMLSNLAFVHVDAPGHEDGAAPLPATTTALSLELLAQQLHTIIEQLDLPTQFLGMGAGAGANVLLRYAADHGVGRLHGLVLLNPSLSLPTRCERFALGLVRWMLTSPLASRASAVMMMAKIHYSQRALACKSTPRAYAKSHRVSPPPAVVSGKRVATLLAHSRSLAAAVHVASVH